jgi:hypothetical protein
VHARVPAKARADGHTAAQPEIDTQAAAAARDPETRARGPEPEAWTELERHPELERPALRP